MLSQGPLSSQMQTAAYSLIVKMPRVVPLPLAELPPSECSGCSFSFTRDSGDLDTRGHGRKHQTSMAISETHFRRWTWPDSNDDPELVPGLRNVLASVGLTDFIRK